MIVVHNWDLEKQTLMHLILWYPYIFWTQAQAEALVIDNFVFYF